MSYSDNAFASLTRPSKMRPGAKVKFDVLLTSYELVSHDQTTLQSIDWAMLVIDEAHKLKNNQSLVGCHGNNCGCYGYWGDCINSRIANHKKIRFEMLACINNVYHSCICKIGLLIQNGGLANMV